MLICLGKAVSMRHIIRYSILLTGLLSFIWPVAADDNTPVDFLSVKDIKHAIQVAIFNAVRENDKNPYFLITNVKVKLQGQKDNNIGGGFKIPIFSAAFDFSANVQTAAGETLEFELTPSEPLATAAPPDLNLSEAIASMKEAFQDDGSTADPPLPVLTPKRFSYSHDWALKAGGNAGINILVVTLEAGAQDELRQSISFDLCLTLNKLNCVPE